jgi:hypothetical protein
MTQKEISGQSRSRRKKDRQTGTPGRNGVKQAHRRTGRREGGRQTGRVVGRKTGRAGQTGISHRGVTIVEDPVSRVVRVFGCNFYNQWQ